MATTGWVLATAGATVDTGGGAAWSNPGNITADDGSSATVLNGTFGSVQSDTLRASGFGLSVPAGATINGIETRAQLSASSTASYSYANVGKDNSTLGTSKNPGDSLSGTLTNYDDGGAADLWGLSWTPAEVNASTFQVLVRTTNNPFVTSNCDAVWVQVHYTEAVTIEGTASITEANDTVSSTGKLAIAGVASVTEAGDTVSSTGKLAIAGTASITEDDDTVAATVIRVTLGTASITEDDDTIAATGALAIAGTASITEDDDTASGQAIIFTRVRTDYADGDLGFYSNYWAQKWRKAHRDVPQEYEEEPDPVFVPLPISQAEYEADRRVSHARMARTIINVGESPSQVAIDQAEDDEEIALLLTTLF